MTITGVGDVRDGLEAITDAVTSGAVFETVADDVRTTAARRINSRTGATRASLTDVRTATGWAITATTPYASFHNTGARSFPGVHFLTVDPAQAATAASNHLDTLINRHLKD